MSQNIIQKKTTPNNAFNGTTSTNDLLGAIFPKAAIKAMPKKKPPEFKVGDLVYLPKPETGREIEKKGADKWFREPYKIEKIINSSPLTYLVNGKKYYAQQLKYATK